MEGKEGWVYVLTNEAMPGLVKVGYTMKDPAIRAQDLYKDPKIGALAGVPMPFVVAYKALVVNPYQVEQAVHKLLEKKRLNEEREFFHVNRLRRFGISVTAPRLSLRNRKRTLTRGFSNRKN